MCYEVCASIGEARRNRTSYGDGCVIVRIHRLDIDSSPPAYENEEIVE